MILYNPITWFSISQFVSLFLLKQLITYYSNHRKSDADDQFASCFQKVAAYSTKLQTKSRSLLPKSQELGLGAELEPKSCNWDWSQEPKIWEQSHLFGASKRASSQPLLIPEGRLVNICSKILTFSWMFLMCLTAYSLLRVSGWQKNLSQKQNTWTTTWTFKIYMYCKTCPWWTLYKLESCHIIEKISGPNKLDRALSTLFIGLYQETVYNGKFFWLQAIML